ncbi:MAG: Pr6Pr family membrane protein [Dichotomicrobium sp.]
MKPLFRLLLGVVTLAGIVLSYFYGPHNEIADAVTRNVSYFSFFTIQTNILVALATLVPVFAPSSAAGRFFDSAPVRTAIANYIIVVGVVYDILLAQLWEPEGLNLISLVILHYITPVMFVADWLLFNEKGETRWTGSVWVLAYPAVYAAWTLARGAMTGWYPYPFIDVADLGYAVALRNMAALAAAFVVLQLVLIGIDKSLTLLKYGTARSHARQ